MLALRRIATSSSAALSKPKLTSSSTSSNQFIPYFASIRFSHSIKNNIQNMSSSPNTSSVLAPPASAASTQHHSTQSSTYSKVLTASSINRNIAKAEYAVRGEIPIRAEEIQLELKADPSKFPFSEIVRCNIGNPQELQQKPLTFFRQVCSLIEYDDLLAPENHDVVSKLYPADAIDRARKIRSSLASTGAYTHSQGLKFIRDDVAKCIFERDGFPADPNDIFLTNGASDGVKAAMQMIVQSTTSGIMIPIPQYPLYSATLAVLDGAPVPYYLDEENKWGLSNEELKSSLQKARENGIDVRALVIINPGNPTGACLSENSMRDIVKFCHNERLVLLADEVYQTNIYQPETSPFISFRKVLKGMPAEFQDVELISFHSVSKGFVGECGKRGGYMELIGIDEATRAQMYKMSSISLCPNVQGQILVDLMVNPPKEGDESYPLYNQEREGILISLKERAQTLVSAFQKMEGVTCNYAEGAMYTFPQIRLPPKAVQAAALAGKVPDVFYCLNLLEATGVCVVPGSGFRQKDGTFHFRCTFLPPQKDFPVFTESILKFHRTFMDKYRD